MKKTILLFAVLFSMMSIAQTCGFDRVQNALENKYPEIKKSREAAEAKLLKMDVKSYLNKIGATSRNGLYTGTIYEIPVVVHVITSSDASNAGLSLSDAQIQTWIDNCNKMYATTYGGNFAAEGPGSLDGNVIPFKLVMAKRTPQCTPSNGILRVSGSSLAGYDQFGVKSETTNGVDEQAIKTLSPHWPESSYFNIYIIIGFDGNKSTSGLMGYCGLPTNPDSAYDSFMKVTVVTNTNDSTLAHEFGHGLGLLHPFDGANSSPGANPTVADCPVNNDCTTDNDKVCDTSPTASLLSVFPTPSNADINPCTATNWDGVQYNIMNYTNDERKFTAGQRDRGIAMFMASRSNLTKSLGGTDLTTDPGAGTLVASTCSPASVANTGNFQVGPTKVLLGTIDNPSEASNTGNGNQFYADYSLQNCASKIFATEIPDNSASQLSVSFQTNPQNIKAWIDYNNNGTFESSELIGASPSSVATANSPYVITFTPPSTAVKNTYLRMRVIADIGDDNPCDNMNYGQAEDYSVKITTTLATTENTKSVGAVVYSKSDNKLTLYSSSKGFGSYEVYDMAGKLVQKGIASQDVFLKRRLPKGTYIIRYQNTSQKFINQ